MNKDRASDVIFIDDGGLLNVLNGRNGEVLWALNQPITERVGAAFVADLDRNAFLDLILVSESGSVYQYQSNQKFPASAVVWGQFLGAPTNILSSEYRLPDSSGAFALLLIGGLLLIGTGTAVTILKLRRKRFV